MQTASSSGNQTSVQACWSRYKRCSAVGIATVLPISIPHNSTLFLALMASKSQSSDSQPDRVVYSEFGNASSDAAFERAKPDLPPKQQNLRVETSRAGRKGKTVTIVRGFQTSQEAMNTLLKQLKTQCGTGGTVKEDTIELQGDHKQKILEFLLKQGYKAKGSGG